MNLAIGEVFCASLAKNTVVIGTYQGSYGIGGIIAPLIATSLISRGYVWSRFYTIELGLAVVNLIFAPWTFWNYEQEFDPTLPPPTSGRADNVQHKYDMSNSFKRSWKSFKTLVSNKPTVLGASFIFAYRERKF